MYISSYGDYDPDTDSFGPGVLYKTDQSGNTTVFATIDNSPNQPGQMTFDYSGNLYIVWNGMKIYKITPGGTVSILAGGNNVDILDGIGLNARFSGINAITSDTSGNMYVSDNEVIDNNYRITIRRITPGGTVTTLINTRAGYSDGILAKAKMNYLVNITSDINNNLYMVDRDNFIIRKINLNTSG